MMADSAAIDDDQDDGQTLPENVRYMRDYCLDRHDVMEDIAERLRSAELCDMGRGNVRRSQQQLQETLDAARKWFMEISIYLDGLADVIDEDADGEEWKTK